MAKMASRVREVGDRENIIMMWLIETEDEPRRLEPGETGIDPTDGEMLYRAKTLGRTFCSYYVVIPNQTLRKVKDVKGEIL